MIALIQFMFAMLAAPFRSKSQLEAENAALRQQLIVLQRKMKGRIAISNGDRLFLRPALSMVPIDPRSHHNHPARNVGALASGGLSSLLALEIMATRRTAEDYDGTSDADPADEFSTTSCGARRAFTANC